MDERPLGAGARLTGFRERPLRALSIFLGGIVHSHTYAYGDICQMFLIWQREGDLSSERLSQFASKLLENFDLDPDEVLELMASLPS